MTTTILERTEGERKFALRVYRIKDIRCSNCSQTTEASVINNGKDGELGRYECACGYSTYYFKPRVEMWR